MRADLRNLHESNRVAWNEASVLYRRTLDDSVQLLRGGGTSFRPQELAVFENLVPGAARCIHLQCAGGADTLSLINLGAREVVGLDISEEMIAVARQKSERLGMNARWIVSDVLDAPAELDGTADLVYTGRGAISWIMDLGAWAQVVMRLLRPGGSFFLFEGHPFTYMFRIEARELEIDPWFAGYFSGKVYETQNWPESYVGKIKESIAEQAVKFEQAWPVSSVLNALLDAGLELERFSEYPDAYWSEFPNMPEATREKFPNTYSLLMRRPRNM
jgi:SAM-dependent methyltransferase